MKPLWIDEPNALELIEQADAEDYVREAALEIVNNGLAIIRGAHSVNKCNAVIEEYERYREENLQYVMENLDENGHEKRLVDFHHTSQAAEAIGNKPYVLRILDFIFGMQAGIYTSLTFKYGTQQPVHRDTPHFATWPRNYFVGCWTALQDVEPDAGPLFYYRCAHRFDIDERDVIEQARKQLPHSSRSEQLSHALDLYNGRVIDGVEKYGPPMVMDLRAGDTVIWHAQTPHGGMPAKNNEATRWSIVFHCAPIDVQVYQHDAFFSNASSDDAPPPRYGFREAGGRKIAVAGATSFM